MKNKFKLFLIVNIMIMLATFLTSESVFAAGGLAKEHPGVTSVEHGTQMDSDYSFSLKKTDSTSIEFWGYSDKIINMFNSSSNTTNYITFPKDDALSGNMGCWLNNVGTYKGDNVDVKCTFYWNPVTIDDTPIHPTIIVRERNDLIGFGFATQAYEIKFDLYKKDESGQRQPLYTNMAISLGDVDCLQYFGVKTDAQINSIMCQNDSIVSYDYADGYHWAYEASGQSSGDGLESVLRFELKDVNSFNVVFGPEYDGDSYYMKTAGKNQKTMLDNMKTITELFNNDSYQTGTQYPYITLPIGWGYFNSVGFGPYDVPEPKKTVDKDKVTDNDKFTYTISHRVPDTSAYDSYVFKDTLADCLTIDSVDDVKILDDGNKDVTSKFNVSIDGKVVKAELKDLKDTAFYNNEYRFMFTVHKDKNYTDMSKYEKLDDGYYRVPNTAQVVINGETYSTNTQHVDVQITHKITTAVDGEGGEISGQNQEVYETVVHEKDSKLPIVVRPDAKHQIASIKVNGTPIEFEIEEDGSYTLDQFTKVTEDIHVVASFEKRKNVVVTKYKDYYTKAEIDKSTTAKYEEGQEYTTQKKDITGYVFFEDSGNTTGTMETSDIEVVYYYKQISGGLIVKYVDKFSNKELDSREYEGNVRDLIELEELSFENYKLSSRPEENMVELEVEPLVKYFYYVQKVDLKIKGIDEDTGEELYTDSQTGYEGDQYTTEPQDVSGYEVSVIPDNKDGVHSRDNDEVVYKYKKKAGEVKVRYLDKDTNDVLDEYSINGLVGDKYSTDKKEFEYYTFVEVVGEEEGTLDHTEKEVKYYYEKKRGKVIVTYEDRDGNILQEEELEGRVEDKFTIVEEKIEDYDIVERPDSLEGEFEDGTIYKKFVVEKRRGKITVNFKDTEGEEMYPSITDEGYVKDPYDYEAPDKSGYRIVENEEIHVHYEDGEIVIDVIYEKLPDTSDINVYMLFEVLVVSLLAISRIVKNLINN